MTETQDWLKKFGARQEDTNNPGIYWASLLVLLLGVVGLLWALPVPDALLKISPALNWGTVFLMASLVYYFIISVSLGVGMIPFIVGVVALQMHVAEMSIPEGYAASLMVGLGISGLAFGHYASGGLRAVIHDVQLLMIAPLWLLSKFYRRLGIPY